jgi:tetratricopeptide (TPR) repeat protein
MSFCAALVLILVILVSLPAKKSFINKKISATVHYNLAKDLYKEGQYAEAAHELVKASKYNDKDSMIFLELGKNYIKLSKLDQAIINLRKSINLNKINVDAYIDLGKLYNDKSDYKSTIKLLSPFKSSKDPRILALLAEAQYRNDYPALAEENLKKAIAIAPDNPDYYNSLGLAYLKQNKARDAIFQFKKAISLNNTSSELRCNLAKAYWFDNKPDYAIEELEKSIKYDINNPEIYYLLGKIYSQYGLYQKANQNFIKIFKINKGEISLEMLKDIVKDMENNVLKSPNANSYHIIAVINTKLNNYNKAISAYEKAIKGNIKDPLIYNNLASLYYQTNNIKKAVFYYEKALSLSPNEAVYYYDLGNCYKKIKNYKKAVISYNKAIKLNPALNIARVALGDLYTAKGDLWMAEYTYNQALQKNPSEPYAYLGLSEAAMKRGMQSKALKYKALYKKFLDEQAEN